jgi:hypothetical protein
MMRNISLKRQALPSWMNLRIVVGVPEGVMALALFRLPFDQGRFAYRIVCRSQGVYGLEKDLDMTESLNEPGSDADDEIALQFSIPPVRSL